MLGCWIWAWRSLSAGVVCGYRGKRRSERGLARPPWSPRLLCAAAELTWHDMVEVEEGEVGEASQGFPILLTWCP